MRSPSLFIFLTATLACTLSPNPSLAGDGGAVMSVEAQIGARASLQPTGSTLRFDASFAGEQYSHTCIVDVVAAARTRAGGEVLLIVESLEGAARPPAPRRIAFTTVSEPAHELYGTWSGNEPQVVARWVGSGRRSARITFALWSDREEPLELPVRWVLATP